MIKDDPIDARSADSRHMLPYWDLTDTLVEGVEAMRRAGDAYLPRFVDERDDNYNYRLRQTKFTNVYRDVVEALANKPFEEPITWGKTPGKELVIPTDLAEFVTDVDGAGSSLTTFGAATFFNGINSAIDWIFVDFPSVDSATIRTQADAKAAGVRPFWSHVLARNMLEVQSMMLAGNEELVYTRILEPGAPDCVRIIRKIGADVFWYLLKKTDGMHAVDPLWCWTQPRADQKTAFVQVETGVISIGVIPLVPYYTGRRNGRSWRFAPVMRDAADLQVELYQEESGLKFARVMTAYPMLAGNGVKPPMKPDGKTPLPLNIGPNVVLYSPPDGNGNVGNWEFVEPSASSLTFLAENVQETMQQLRELGRQPLTAQSGNLTVITTAVAAGKAKSAVAAWAGALEHAINKAMHLTCMFWGIKSDGLPPLKVFDDFDDVNTEGKDLDELHAARRNGDLTQKTYWKELKRRRVLSADFDADTEATELALETPGDELEDEGIN